jgi:hypothetical protein
MCMHSAKKRRCDREAGRGANDGIDSAFWAQRGAAGFAARFPVILNPLRNLTGRIDREAIETTAEIR